MRVLQEKGQYIQYNHLDHEPGKKTAKYSLILRSENKKEHLLIILIKTGKSLVVEQKKEKMAFKTTISHLSRISGLAVLPQVIGIC